MSNFKGSFNVDNLCVAFWCIHLVIIDSDNPTNPQTVNHVIVAVNTGQVKLSDRTNVTS